MTVKVATSNQSQALTRSLAGSTGGPRKDPGDASFDGALSNVADDQAGSQPSVATPDKDAADAKTPNGTPSPSSGLVVAPALDGSLSTPTSASLFSLATWAMSTSAAVTSTSGAKGKTGHADAVKEAVDSGPSQTQADPSATPAGLSPQLSLLALVQSAAALSSSAPSTGPAATTATPTSTAQALSNGMPPLAGDQNSASTAPLISDISFQNYLAPVSTIAAPPTAPPLAAAMLQTDVSAGLAAGALIAPLAQAVVGKQTNGGAVGSGNDKAIVQVDPGASATGTDPITSTQVDAGTGTSGAISAPSAWAATAFAQVSPAVATSVPSGKLPPAPASAGSAPPSLAIPTVAMPQASAPLTSTPATLASLDPASAKPAGSDTPVAASAASTSVSPGPSSGSGAPVPVPVIDPATSMPVSAAISAPLQTVADAITSLASQGAGPAQAATDPAQRLSPARTMLLQLNPNELGTVSVRLHLTGRTLDVSLTVSQDQTAALLDHGRDALTRAIGDQDYQVNALVIQRGDPQRGDTTSLPGSSNATSMDYSRDQAASQGGGDASGGSSRQGTDGSPARQDRSDRQPQPRAAPPRGSGLFL